MRCGSEPVVAIRRPGLYRRWELLEVIDLGRCFRFEEAAATDDGTQLYAIYDVYSESEAAEDPRISTRAAQSGTPIDGDWVQLPGLHYSTEVMRGASAGIWRLEPEVAPKPAGEQLVRVYHHTPVRPDGKDRPW
jgi:hypothetical protein